MQQDQVGMISQLNELMNCIHQVDFNLKIEQIPNRVLLLLGETRAGKTTLLYYLLKKKLLLEVNKQLKVTLMKAEVQYFNAKIGNNYDSTTVYPNIPSEYDDDCLVIDMPGFNDSRPLYRLLNIYIIQETIKKIKNVHVSIVIPFENLEGQALLAALQNTCNLLNNDFLKADHCTSFILTKIQDISYDKEVFDEQMKSLQEYYEGGPIADVLANFEDMNTYIFSKEEPKPEEGGLLKERILAENKFYKIDENPKNLLCQRYAEVMIGKGNLQEFKLYILRILREISTYLPLLIEFFGDLVKFHHFDLLKERLNWSYEADSVKKSIEGMIKKLPLGQISLQNIEIAQKANYPSRADQILAIMSKFKFHGEYQDPELEDIVGDISHFIPYSEFFSREESGISQNLRITVHLAFKNSLLILRTIGSVQDELIRQQLREVSQKEAIKSASRIYRDIFEEQNLAKSLATMPECHQLVVKNNAFKQFILMFNPEFTPPSQVTKIVQIKTHDRLKNHKWQHSVLQTSKSTHQPAPQIKKTTQQLITLTPKNISETQSLQAQLTAMISTKANLETVLKSIAELKGKHQKEKGYMHYYSQLWRKAVSILSDLCLFEEAILFALGIPDEVEAENLIDTGIRFQQLSEQFTESILIPYYSNVAFNFEQLQKLINYLSVRALTRQRLLSLQKKYANILVQMRKMLQEKNASVGFSIKRFNIAFVAHLIGTEARSEALQRAEQNSKKLMNSKLLHQSMKNHLLKLREDVYVR